MGRSFKNYALSIGAGVSMICFVVCAVLLLRFDFTYNTRVAVIALTIISFFVALYLLMQIRGGKNKG